MPEHSTSHRQGFYQRTDLGGRPFPMIGIDYAGPIKCGGGKEIKAYVLLFACSLTRAVYVEVVTDMTVE